MTVVIGAVGRRVLKYFSGMMILEMLLMDSAERGGIVGGSKVIARGLHAVFQRFYIMLTHRE
jgi:hypothetical protein